MDEVILVDELDNEVGVMEKMEAHQQGKLHRCISVFVFHPDGRLMLQKRAKGKYHSGGLWSNTCCSHPRPGEGVAAAAHRRLWEETGFGCALTEVHAFIYRTEFQNGLIEHEYDHVFVGVSDATPSLNPAEAEEWKWMTPSDLHSDLSVHPEAYTYWLRVALDDVLRLRSA